MGTFGAQELIIILVIVLLLFGVGRVSKISRELGSGIRSFKEGLKGDDEEEEKEKESESAVPPEIQKEPEITEPAETKDGNS